MAIDLTNPTTALLKIESRSSSLVGPADETNFQALDGLDLVGRIGTTDLIYVWRVEQDGKQYIVGVSRPRGGGRMGSMVQAPGFLRTREHHVLYPLRNHVPTRARRVGNGDRILAPSVYPKFESNGTVQIETGTADLIQLTAATRR